MAINILYWSNILHSFHVTMHDPHWNLGCWRLQQWCAGRFFFTCLKNLFQIKACFFVCYKKELVCASTRRNLLQELKKWSIFRRAAGMPKHAYGIFHGTNWSSTLISPAEMARLEPSQPQHASEKGFYVLVNFFLEFSHLMTRPVEMKELIAGRVHSCYWRRKIILLLTNDAAAKSTKYVNSPIFLHQETHCLVKVENFRQTISNHLIGSFHETVTCWCEVQTVSSRRMFRVY